MDKTYLDVLKENLEASKRHQNRGVRKLLVQTYEDLISIWEANYSGKIWHPEFNYGLELQLSEEAHDKTIDQLRKNQEDLYFWRELCVEMLNEMNQAEWDSPIQRKVSELIKKTK